MPSLSPWRAPRLAACMTARAMSGVLIIAEPQRTLPNSTFQLKLVLLAGLVVYHYRCYLWTVRLKTMEPSDDTRWLRWFNEIPVLFLLGIICLAIVKPF